MTKVEDNSLTPAISVIIPARNEEAQIEQCLMSMCEQESAPKPMEVIVAANGCDDGTAKAALSKAASLSECSIILKVIDLPEGGKPQALTAAESVAQGQVLIYLDADVICEPRLISQLFAELDSSKPLYATGRMKIVSPRTAVTRCYARIWARLPFFRSGAIGAGLFAMNRAGRRRWGKWPGIISDDTFARLQFTPDERIEVTAAYHWPMVEGFGNLVRVRRRQDAGVAEIRKSFPRLLVNEQKENLSVRYLAKLVLGDPIGFTVYFAVHIAVRVKRAPKEWTRGR